MTRRTPDDLVVRAKTDRDAFGELFDRYFPIIWRYCRRRQFDASTADDLASEVFLQVARAMRGFSGSTELDFRRWVYRIATNTINAHARKGARRGELERDAVDQGRWPSANAIMIATANDPTGEKVQQALAQLSPREQSVLTLRFIEGLSYDEVAAIEGVRSATLRVIVSRALERLRNHLSVTREAPRETPQSSD